MIKSTDERGLDGFDREVLRRLPLAEAVLSLWGYLMDEEFLAGVFERHRGRSFKAVLTFPVLVDLIADALFMHRGSGRQAFVRAREDKVLTISVEATYGKLRRLPVSLSIGLLEEGTARLREVRPAAAALAWPQALSAFTPVIVDGKKIKRVAKRVLVARGQPGKLYGGKILAAYVPTEDLVRAFSANPDGEANDCKLLPELVPRARLAIAGPRLWIADRQFCDQTQPRLLAQEGDHFVIRYHSRNLFEQDPARPSGTSRDAQGRELIDEWGWLGSVKSQRLYVRRTRLLRAGEEEIIVITDLLDETTYPAADLLQAYLERWGIEQVFQQITEVFHLEQLIGSTPQATIFQAAFCLLMYNLLQTIRQHIAATPAAPLTPPPPPDPVTPPPPPDPVTPPPPPDPVTPPPPDPVTTIPPEPVTTIPPDPVTTIPPEPATTPTRIAQVTTTLPARVTIASLSTEEIFRDVTRQLTALTELIHPTYVTPLIPRFSSAIELQHSLARLLSMPIPKLWHKTKNKNPRKKTTPQKQSGAHTSIAKLQAAAKLKQTTKLKKP